MSITDMDYIKGIVRLLKENGLNRLEIEDNGTKVVAEKWAEQSAPMAAPPAAANVSVDSRPEAGPVPDIIDFNNVFEVKAPLVGVFYSAPSPDDEPFVRIGDEVQKGDVLCIIEAMKLMNEIAAERDGRVVDICVKNGDIAEFGQVLFKLG